jgi:uncharacterized protein (DUF1810 family)
MAWFEWPICRRSIIENGQRRRLRNPLSDSTMTPSDPFDLHRFVVAQASLFDKALAELRAGQKRSHWMWFIFPQLRGLGSSAMAGRYGIVSLAEAQAYLHHTVLGSRLLICVETVLATKGGKLHRIFGSPDDLKFCSSMTLFSCASADGPGQFREALDRYCDGVRDERTMTLLRSLDRG